MTRGRRTPTFLLAASCALLALPLPAAADDGDEVRKAGACTASSSVALRLKADDGRIEVDVRLRTNRPRSRWTVIVLHERRTALRVSRLTDSEGSLEIERGVPDWLGPDAVAVRATGPRNERCRVSATL